MSNALQRISRAKNVSDVAILIGFKPKYLAYILYKISDDAKYTTFEVAKRSGGKRKIDAPIRRLKLAQRRLHELLSQCLIEIEKIEGVKEDCVLSHGFRAKRSIVTNAQNHRGRRWVFNIDLKDFFPSINFGRVRGYFIKNRHFRLDENAATVLAQIICHNNQLPQGSPCSPIVSNLLAHMLDIRLNRMASRHRCTYTRYADDLTFSSNKKDFPLDIAVVVDELGHQWEPSDRLRYQVSQSGFKINKAKTRMQFYWSRQDATGLVVNKKINIKREYVKLARARCDRLFKLGECFQKFQYYGETYEEPYDVERLQGMLGHIFRIKGEEFEHKRLDDIFKDQPNFYKIYRQFLDYRAFAANEIPTLVFEGMTDSIYVRCALQAFEKNYPALIVGDGTKQLKVRFYRYSQTSDAVQHLRGGTGDLRQLIYHYIGRIRPFDNAPFASPVILIVDNDQGSNGKKGLFAAIKKVSKSMNAVDGSKRYYHVTKNLYVVPTPKLAGGNDSMIESFLPKEVLDIELNGKRLHLSNEGLDRSKHFGKTILAEHVKKNKANINLVGYRPLLNAISEAIAHFALQPK